MTNKTLPDGWQWKKLGEIAEVKRGKSKHRPRNDKSLFGGEFPFIQTGDIRNAEKYITQFGETYNEKGLEQSKLWKKGTICLTIAANIGDVTILGIDACFPDSVVGIFSTENDGEYIYYFLTTLKERLEAKATKSAQMNLNVEKLVEFEIPLPPLEEQKRIVAKIDAAFEQLDEAISLQKNNILRTETLKKALLVEQFSELPYEKKKLGEIAEVKRGKSKHRPRNDKSLFGGKYPFIQTGDVRGAAKYITEYSETYNEKGLEQSKLWKKGTVCLTIAANIGEVTILGIDACFPDSVVGIISSKNNNEFIYYYLTTLKTQLEAKATQAAQMNLNVEKLVEFEIPLPPIAEQEKIVAYLDKSFAEIDKMLEAQKTRLAHLEGMKKAILQEAFEGKL
jgi:type I restriction enzyme S subunit